jgi:hypothetical protein
MCPCLLLLDLRSLILSLRLLVVWFRKNLILLVGLAPRSCEKDLSQTGAVFPIEESWISKSLLLKLLGKELAPNPEKEEP